jgi:hypothetical protein
VHIDPAPGLNLPGGNATFEIAGLRFGFEITPALSGVFEPPAAFQAFRVGGEQRNVTVRVQNLDADGRAQGPLLYDSGVNWRLRQVDGLYLYEWYHPPTSDVLLNALVCPAGRFVAIGFDARRWSERRDREVGPGGVPRFSLLPPFEQLPFLVPFARHGSFLVHACGAVIDGRSYVFAGHSGDGKTTLARLLASEGVELLSDERVALRRRGEAFDAFGTPWAGEGRVISTKSYPLAAVFLLHQAGHHRVRAAAPGALAAELLARSIVPYYLRDEADLILSLMEGLANTVPLRELHFGLKPGLVHLVREVESVSAPARV